MTVGRYRCELLTVDLCQYVTGYYRNIEQNQASLATTQRDTVDICYRIPVAVNMLLFLEMLGMSWSIVSFLG